MRSDNEPRKIKDLGFKTWFTDVLWYHYKWVILGLLASLVAGTVIIGQLFFKTKDDVEIILGVSKIIKAEKVNDLKLAIGDILGDVNGDGKIIININQLLLNPETDDYDPSSSADATTMLSTFLRKDIVLYLFDKINLGIYAGPGNERFNAKLAATYGSSYGAVPLGEVELFKKLGLTGEDELFACFKVKTFNVKTSDQKYYQTARKIMDGLVSGNS